MSRLGDVGLVHHFEQALSSHLRENIYQLHPMPRTWAEWKCEASILDNQWRQFNATCPQMMMMMKNPVATSSHSACQGASKTRSVCDVQVPVELRCIYEGSLKGNGSLLNA